MNRPSMSPVVKFLLMATAVYAVAFLGAQATINAAGYYETLVRPRWASPAWLFGPVWTILYGMMAVAAYLVWNEPDDRRRGALIFFWVQLLLNGLWSWIFFAWKQTLWAGIEIVILWLAILANTFLFARIRARAAWLMVPYLLWVTYAAALNWAIYLQNR